MNKENKKQSAGNKSGRPCKYETHVKPNLDLVESWARDGATEADIAKKLKISHDTLIEYKKQFSEFSEALKKGREVVDGQVENALLKRALGYEYDEETTELRGGEMVLTKIVRKQIVPDVGAQAFWLKNRRPDLWRDKHDMSMEVSGSESQTELREYLQELKRGKG